MARFRYLTLTVPILCGFLLLTACSPIETTAQTCERMTLLQDDIAQFETTPTGDPAERVDTVREFAVELDRIQAATGHGQLAFSAATLADMYWTIADVAASHPQLSSWELMHRVESQIKVEHINKANETYLHVCQVK